MKTDKPPKNRDRKAASPQPPESHPPFQPPPQSPRSSKLPLFPLVHVFKALSWMTTGAAVIMASIVLLGVWRSGNDFISQLATLLDPPKESTQIDIRSMVVQQIRSSSELTTATFSMETVVPARRDRTLGNYVVGSTTLLYIGYGEVRAGVDLSAIQPENVQVIGNRVRLQLPAPRILDTKVDVSRSRVYDYDRGFMGLGPDVAPELQEMAQREMLNKLAAAACSEGVLQVASDRAKLAVSQLLAVAGYQNLTVDIQPPATDTCAIASPSVNPSANLSVSPPSPSVSPSLSLPVSPTSSTSPTMTQELPLPPQELPSP